MAKKGDSGFHFPVGTPLGNVQEVIHKTGEFNRIYIGKTRIKIGRVGWLIIASVPVIMVLFVYFYMAGR